MARTDTGKQRSALNAVTHGLTSCTALVVPGENPDELHAFVTGVCKALAPHGVLETALAQRVAFALWRVQRAARAEARFLTQQEPDAVAQLLTWPHNSNAPDTAPWPRPAWDEFNGTAGPLGNIARYEAHLERTAYRTLHELQRLQAQRNGVPVGVPAAVDVDVNGARLE